MVKLLNIETISSEQELDKEFNVLLPPQIELGIDVAHKEDNLNFVHFTITYSLFSIDNFPVLKLKTKSIFSIEEEKANFYGNVKSSLIDLLSHLATASVAHNFGILSVATSFFPIPKTSLYSLVTPNDFRQMIVEILHSMKN